jgi:hypothetical protein
MYISDEDYCLEVNNITKTKTEIKTIRTCYLVNTDKHSSNRDHFVLSVNQQIKCCFCGILVHLTFLMMIWMASYHLF